MQLPDEAYQQFKQIYQKKFGVVLSDTEAKAKAQKLLRLYRVVKTGKVSR